MPAPPARKRFLKAEDFPCARFEYATSPESLVKAVETIGFPSVIKTAAFGYDGKGQIKLDDPSAIKEPESLWESLNRPERVVVEEWIQHKGEFSVVCARQADGSLSTFPVAENEHIHHILTDPSHQLAWRMTLQEADRLARAIAERLDVVGLIAIEFFLSPDNQLIVNEMAPVLTTPDITPSMPATPPNFNSTFEQLLTASRDTQIHSPCVMINLLGDLWAKGEPLWDLALKNPKVQLPYDKVGEKGTKNGAF